MSVKDAILATQPTSYWPLDDLSGSSSVTARWACTMRHCPWRASRFRSFPWDVAGTVFRRRLGERPNRPRRSAIFATLRQRADRRGLAVSARAQQCERGRRAGQVRPLRRKGGCGVGRRRVGAQILQSAKSDPPFAPLVLDVQPRLAYRRGQWLLHGIWRLEER
jgi:hypothetical protein